MKALLETHLENIPLFRKGKVRDVYDLGDQLLIVVTDRISAFDCVFPNGIPEKGKILNQISAFWFEQTKEVVSNHMISTQVQDFPDALQPFSAQLEGRSMLVKKCKPLPVECIVRGYIAGSGWKEYQRSGTVCSIELPANLQLSEKLPKPLFTPSTKAEEGHDENISYEEMAKILGNEMAEKVRDLSLKLYMNARDFLAEKGIILADTKFEFGELDGELILIDEALTPDSSRFWLEKQYQIGQAQQSMDKQFVRDFVEQSGWNKQPPAPELPNQIIEQTLARYREAFQRITQ